MYYGNGRFNVVCVTVTLNISGSVEWLYPSHMEYLESVHALSVLSEIIMGYHFPWQID